MLRRAALARTPDYRDKVAWLLQRGYAPGRTEPLFRREGPLEAAGSRGRGVDTAGEALVLRLTFLHEKGFRLGHKAVQYVLTGEQDEPAAVAFLLDKSGLHAAGDAALVVGTACRHRRRQSLELLQTRGWLEAVGAPEYPALRYCAGRGRECDAAWLVEALCGGEGGQPLTAQLFARAAEVGDVRLLGRLRARGCPWDRTAWYMTSMGHGACEAVLRWLNLAGCPKPVSAAGSVLSRKPARASAGPRLSSPPLLCRLRPRHASSKRLRVAT